MTCGFYSNFDWVTKDLKDLGGNVFNATKYFIQQHFAAAKIVIRSLAIAEYVIQND